ncbi:MAG: hypothetical protein ACRCX2_35675 [Paraclostridium sp.]
MVNENNIINQIQKEAEVKKSVTDYVNELYNTYINTINNSDLKYYNVEDERVLDDVKILSTSEIGIDLSGEKLLHIGNCKRNLFFKLTGAIMLDKDVSEIEVLERNMLIKEQWVKKFAFAKVLVTPDDDVIEKELRGVKFKSSCDGHIKDYINEKVFTLMIKPVNDSAFAVKDRLWPNFGGKPEPLNEHLSEAATLMIYYKKPVKILYVGKNNASLTKEFNIGIQEGSLSIDGEKNEDFNMNLLLKEIDDVKKMLTEDMIPPRDYIAPRQLNIDEIHQLKRRNMIISREEQELRNGKEYENFHCKSCKYRELCQAIGEGWVKKNG